VPTVLSSDQARFTVSLDLDQCSILEFDDQVLPDIDFVIGGIPDPATETFPDFTNALPVGDTCGPRKY